MLNLSQNTRTALIAAFVIPLAKAALKFGIKFQEIASLLRSTLLVLAEQELAQKKEKSTASRLSIMTGLSRREVASKGERGFATDDKALHLLGNVIGRWQTDKRFTNSKKTPRPLSHGFISSEFYELVELTSRDLNPATVLFELARVGAVTVKGKHVILNAQSFAPRADPVKIFEILRNDICDLTEAVQENVFAKARETNLHARTFFDKIRADKEKELKEWLLKEGHELHARVREKLASLDQDINPNPAYSGPTMAVTFGTFSLVKEQ